MPAFASDCRHMSAEVGRSLHKTYLIAVQGLEKINGSLEEICSFLSSRVSRVATGLERADACPMLAPFMRPERGIITSGVLPVRVHVVQDILLAEGSQKRLDLGSSVRSTCVTISIVSPVAVIGPKPVDGP